MWRIKHHKQFEKLICSKCFADIHKNYAPCASCERCYDFELGYRACKKKKIRKLASQLTKVIHKGEHK